MKDGPVLASRRGSRPPSQSSQVSWRRSRSCRSPGISRSRGWLRRNPCTALPAGVSRGVVGVRGVAGVLEPFQPDTREAVAVRAGWSSRADSGRGHLDVDQHTAF
jgi:hypothetical protein